MFITCDHIDSFFRECPDLLESKEVKIISAASDYGVSLQEEYPPDQDFRRWIPMLGMSSVGYRDLYVPARMNQHRCLGSDKYAIRSYSWMNSTFGSTPQHCEWYCTNSEIPDNEHIPFGVDTESWALIQKYKDTPKKERVFCSWSNNTNERLRLRHQLRGAGGFVFFDDIDKETFIYELSSSKFCICPEGNGKDSYRILQSLYCGSTPLLTKNKWSPYGDLTGTIDLETLTISADKQTDWDLVDFDYWRNKIDH